MKLAVLVSGGGSNFQAILDAAESGDLGAQVAVCVSSRPDAGAIERAKRHGVPVEVLDTALFRDSNALSDRLLALFDDYAVDFVVLAGFMKMIPQAVVAAFRNRMLNIHPALLPAFGGPGMYGRRVHAAVLEDGVRYSGATVHLVDENYDTGPIVLQESVPVQGDDTPESLASRVLVVEHRLFPAAIRLFAEGRVRIDGRRVYIVDAD